MSRSTMAASETARVVSKARYDQQHFISIPALTIPLASSSIRIKTVLIGLSANNLAYCAAGDLLHWWSTYPVPSSAPAPYNDLQNYGIAVGWGYCVVIDTTIDTIEPGRILNGFVPVSSHSVDLQLRQVSNMPTHFIETSPHRAKVMSLYQRYLLQPEDFEIDLASPAIMLTPTLKPVWGASYALAKYVFPHDSSTEPIHPFGAPVSPWTKEHADLTDTCIICIGSGTKTSRGFLQQLAVTRSTPKFTVIEVTSSQKDCETYLYPIKIPFKHSRIGYDEISPSAFKGQHTARKYVILNFGGGRNNSLERIASAISSATPGAEILVLQIGGEAQYVEPEQAKAKREILQKLGAVQMNATGIKDEAMKREGDVKYFEGLERAWKGVLETAQVGKDGKIGVLGVEVSVLEGDEGIERCWDRLCEGEVEGSEGLLVRLNGDGNYV